MFCDGWAYHQASTRDDACKRSALVASGKFWTWSVTWEDVQAGMDGKVETTLTDGLEAMCFNIKSDLPPQLRPTLNDSIWSQHAVAVLLQWLGRPAGDGADQQANKLARHAAATAFLMVPNPTNAALEDARNQLLKFWNDRQDWAVDRPVQGAACGNVNDACLMLRYWWPRELANPAATVPVSPGFVIYNNAQLQGEPERHLVWRRWLWLFNIFQTLPGFLLATQEGIDSGDYSSLKYSPTPDPD